MARYAVKVAALVLTLLLLPTTLQPDLQFLSAMVQRQDPPPRRDDKYRDDPDAYCMAGPPLESQKPHAHECHCVMKCGPDTDDPTGPPVRQRDTTCELDCSEKERCLCHGDQSCDAMEEPPR